MAYVIKEVTNTGVDWPFAITKDELIRRLNIICDEMNSPKRSIDILVNGTGEKQEKFAK